MKNLIIFLLLLLSVTLSMSASNIIAPVKRFGSDYLICPKRIIASNGEIYIIEPQMSHIVIFSTTGDFKMNLGSVGEGPKEFKQLSFFTVSNNMIYCYDGVNRRISLFSQKDKKLLKYITLDKTVDNYPPSKMVIYPDGNMIFFNNGVIQEHKLLGIYNPDGHRIKQILPAFPAYQTEHESDNDNDPNSRSHINFFKNAGFIATANKKIYYANLIENLVTELDINGVVLNRIKFPLPSHEKTFRLVSSTHGASGNIYYEENQLTYDLKAVHSCITILCRDNGFSYIFRLDNGKFTEVCRMKEQLTMFDILDNQLFALEEEPRDEDKGFEVLVYHLPKNWNQ